MLGPRGYEPNPDFGFVIRGNVAQLVLQEGIAKAFERLPGKALWIFHTSLQSRDDFLEQEAVQPVADLWIEHGFAHHRDAARLGVVHQGCVGSVQDANFAQEIWPDIRRRKDGWMTEQA